MRAVDGAGRPTSSTVGFSSIFNLTIDTTPPAAPVLDLPGDEAFLNNQDRQLLFSWNASTSSDIDRYRLQVVRAGAPFQAPFVINELVAATQFTGDLTAELDGAFNWRVGALDTAEPSNETLGPDVRTFTLDTDIVDPGLVAPTGIIGNQQPRFEWAHADLSPVTFNLRVAQLPTGDINSGPFVLDTNTTDSFFDILFDLAVDPATKTGDYAWSVRATDDAGNQSNFVVGNFTIDLNFPQIVLISPLDGDLFITTVGTFQWRATGVAAASYDLQIATTDFTTPLEEVTLDHVGPQGSEQVHTLFVPLGDGNYKWRVKGRSVFDITDGYVEAAFTVDLFPPDAPVLLAPVNGR